MTYPLDKFIPLNNYSVNDWEAILEQGCYRGYNINKIAKGIKTGAFSNIIFNPKKETFKFHSNEVIKLKLDKITKFKSTWSYSRLKYWVKKAIFCKDISNHQEKIKNLAVLIHKKLAESSRDLEKQGWKKYKNFYENTHSLDLLTSDNVNNLLSTTHISTTHFSDSHKKMLVGAHKVKQLYKKTHYTFIHGQPLSFWVLNQFRKELIKLSDETGDVSLFHFLRNPVHGQKTTPKNYDRSDIIDSNLGTQLLSVDAYFFHKISHESANDFVARNASMDNSHATILNAILSSSLGDINTAPLALQVETLQELCNSYNKEETIGNIYAICIPKNKITEVAYSAHPFGVHCHCVTKATHKRQLNEIQNDIVPNDLCGTTKGVAIVWGSLQIPAPQYRIVTDQLNPEEDRIFLFSPVAKDVKNEYKLKIRAIAEQVHAFKNASV